MLFNSPVFLFYFLPSVLVLALWLRLHARSITPFLGCVTLASLVFYAYTDPRWLLLICGSIFTNYMLGRHLSRHGNRMWLATGVAGNLVCLGYFKYVDFFSVSLNAVFGSAIPELNVILPIGISFYTFQQIAYLVDVYRDPGNEHRFLDYAFFVSFFPQLIAGPIVHHRHLIPQLKLVSTRPIVPDLAQGMTLFFLGLAKKVLIADSFSAYVGVGFGQPENLTTLDAWYAAGAYSLQIYFDFSGYSDMAIGLALMFGLRLPVNFDSPYKARSIVDFWRRWHMTLSAFLKDYLYIALGGNRKGSARRYTNLLVTMLLGGLWHGAGWGFVIWGGLHGMYLCVNHGLARLNLPGWLRHLGWPIVLLAVVVAWVPFRSPDLTTTWMMWSAMMGASSAQTPVLDGSLGLALIAGCAAVCFLPNSQQIIDMLFRDVERQRVFMKAMPAYTRSLFAAGVGFLAAVGLARNNQIAEFLYFQF
jgi:D-alanyl-lipoteichoic acid acyltransferase DltB (MBOAT superfamily)